MNHSNTSLSLAVLAALASGSVLAEASPFGMQPLSQGYQVADAKGAEGKCGASGEAMKTEEGKCGANAAAPKAPEGKCGANQ